MALSHNVMLLLDTAGGAAVQSPVRRVALRLLIYLSCRFGLTRVRWAFRFFDSQGARSRPSRVSDFRELGARSWEDFEEELEARLGDGAPGAHLPGPAPKATHTHGALMETLLDYQWDRPEITSPTKPVLRSSRRRLLDVEGEAREAEATLGGFGNAVFLLAPCPHSQGELLQFVSGCEAQAQGPLPAPKLVKEKVLPRRVQEVMIARKITLYWVDTTERSKLWESPDHLGYWTVYELLHHVGGTILPSEALSQDCTRSGEPLLSSDHHFSSWISALPLDSTLSCLLYNSTEYVASFPRMEGTLFLPVEGKEIQETWTVILEPLTMHQRHFQKPVRIFLKGTATQWSLPVSGTLGTDSWMLQSPEENKSTQSMLLQQLVNRLTAEAFHLVASVDPGDGWPPITGVISPLFTIAIILTVFHTEEAEFQRHFLQTTVAENPQDTASLFSDVVDVALNQTHSLLEDSATSVPPVPEWAQQELSRTTPWRAAVVETWFPRSNLSGASSDLMESFWLLQAASPNKDESSKTESELTRCLSELYLRKSREESAVSNQEDNKKKRGVPRTPVRQKMNTMCRSLKMLNVARLNVKAQKLHPEGSPDASGEKGTQPRAGGRTVGTLENRGRAQRSTKPKDVKTEEELQSYIHESYEKTVATGETAVYACAQNVISTIKAFLKSKGTKDIEMNCLQQVKSHLLKTRKSLKQSIGENLDKEIKVRECQLQVFLHLEMCRQCPLIHESIDDIEQVVEEVTDLLRMVSLTEDSAYLAKFLEEILGSYIDSIPKTLGQLYDSLGFEIPSKLAGVLPTDFFSDDSITQESKSLLSMPPMSNAHGSALGGTESEQLEELRTRSAKKRRRKNALIRHKSIADISQNLRQIEVSKVSKKAAKNENSHPGLQQPSLPVKETVQEVTKVRRNLFNQEISPSNRSAKRGLPRSHSVSAVEGLECNPDHFRRSKGPRRLLTRTVAETPEHKQVCRRLLHRQIQGRSSDPGPEIDVVEESPEKEISLRRSPRIKQLLLGRVNSGPFYSASQPKSRSVQRVHSFQQNKSDQREQPPIQSVQSPKTLLFGAVSEMASPSEKSSARIRRPSRNTVDSEMPTAFQTPKSHQKLPSSSKATPRRTRRTPEAPLCTPERLQRPPAARTPARQALFQSNGQDSPSPPKLTPQKECPLPEGGVAPLEKIPRTPRPGSQPPGILQNSALQPSGSSSPDSPSPPVTSMLSTALTPVRYSLRPSQGAVALGARREAACVGIPLSQKLQHPPILTASQGKEPAHKWKVEVIKTPEKSGDSALTPSPPISTREFLSSPVCDTPKSPFGKSTEPHRPGELHGKEPQKLCSVATSLPCPAPLAPHKTSPSTKPDIVPRPPPSRTGTRHRKTSGPDSSVLEGQLGVSTAPIGGTSGSLAAVTGVREHQEGKESCPQPSKKHGDPGPGTRSDWHVSFPVLTAGDTQHLPLLEEDEHLVPPVAGGEGFRTVACEKPSLSNVGTPPSLPSSGPSSPLSPSHTLGCAAHGRQCQATLPLEDLQASPQLAEAPTSPQTYEVELQMHASGLPKLRIKKIDTSPPSEAEPLRRDQGVPPSPRGSRSSGKADSTYTYTSPPCLLPSHSSPGKSGGQTYICQSCTPTRCSSSTHSPFQTDTGVPWTPSPKHSGKTTPDTIKDWPRRKRAVGCSLGATMGRGDCGTDLSGGGPLLRPEGKEPGLELGISETPILEDFELEGVCQLPDQSPLRDNVPQAEEASFWGQLGLGSRKRLLSAEEEADCEAKRVCDKQREDSEVQKKEERSPSGRVQQLPSARDNEALVSGSTPPPGCALRSCLSASGLQALTQSPLLFQGRTPSSRRKDATDEDMDVFVPTAEDSPFSHACSRRRPFGRTYSRKKLIS